MCLQIVFCLLAAPGWMSCCSLCVLGMLPLCDWMTPVHSVIMCPSDVYLFVST